MHEYSFSKWRNELTGEFSLILSADAPKSTNAIECKCQGIRHIGSHQRNVAGKKRKEKRENRTPTSTTSTIVTTKTHSHRTSQHQRASPDAEEKERRKKQHGTHLPRDAVAAKARAAAAAAGSRQHSYARMPKVHLIVMKKVRDWYHEKLYENLS